MSTARNMRTYLVDPAHIQKVAARLYNAGHACFAIGMNMRE